MQGCVAFLAGVGHCYFLQSLCFPCGQPLTLLPIRCHANCSWPAITLDSPRCRLLALWPFAAATACCKLWPAATVQLVIATMPLYLCHGSRYPTYTVNVFTTCHYHLALVFVGMPPPPPFVNHTLTPSTYVEVNLFNLIYPLPSPLVSHPAIMGETGWELLFSFSITFTCGTLDKTKNPYTAHPLYIRPCAVHEAGVYHSVG